MRAVLSGVARLSDATDGDEEPVRPDAAQAYPHVTSIRDIFIETVKEITQLLVPKSHQEAVFQVAHYNPIAHGGRQNTRPDNGLILLARWGDVHCWSALTSRPSKERLCAPMLFAMLFPPLMEVLTELIGMDLGRNWDRWLDPLLFAVQEVPNGVHRIFSH